MKSFEKTLKLAVRFEQKLIKFAQAQTAQAGDISKALTDARLFDWNDVSKAIVPMLDKLDYQGKFDTELTVDPTGNVKVVVKGSNPKNGQVQQGLQAYFGPRMALVLKKTKILPAEAMVVGWLSQVG